MSDLSKSYIQIGNVVYPIADEQARNAILAANDNFANAIKKTVKSRQVEIGDVSPISHTVSVRLINRNNVTGLDFTSVILLINDIEYAVNDEGVLEGGITSTYPSMTFSTDDSRVDIEVEYNQDLNYFKNSLNDNFSNAIKKTVSGEVVRMDDVSPIPHNIKVKVTCPEGVDPTSVTVTAGGNTYTPNADGMVDGVISISPSMNFSTDAESVTVEVEYNRDINSVSNELSLSGVIKGTTQTITFNTDGTPNTVTHTDSNGNTVRTDTFIYTGDLIDETRTLLSGEQMKLTLNKKSLIMEVE